MAKRSGKKEPAPRGPYKDDDEDLTVYGLGGIKLRQWRHYKGWTVEFLANKAGVSRGTVSGIEGGKGWGPESLHKLADALGITIGELFMINPLTNPDFIAVWYEATDAQKQRIEDHARGVVPPKRPPRGS